MLQIGQVLRGYCRGYFGDSYEDKRIEAIGFDWVVARDVHGAPQFAVGDGILEELEEFTN